MPSPLTLARAVLIASGWIGALACATTPTTLQAPAGSCVSSDVFSEWTDLNRGTPAPSLEGGELLVRGDAAPQKRARVFFFFDGTQSGGDETVARGLSAIDSLTTRGVADTSIVAHGEGRARARVVELLSKHPTRSRAIWDERGAIAARWALVFTPAAIVVDRDGRVHEYVRLRGDGAEFERDLELSVRGTLRD